MGAGTDRVKLQQHLLQATEGLLASRVQGQLGGLAQCWCLPAIAMETSELLKEGLLSAAKKRVTSACNQAQELLAKRLVPCADGRTEGGCPQAGGRSALHLGYTLTAENLRKTVALFPTLFIQDFSIPSTLHPNYPFPSSSELLSAHFTIPSHLSTGLQGRHPAPTALCPSADPLVCSSLGCSSHLHV